MYTTLRLWVVAVLALPAHFLFAQTPDASSPAQTGTFENPVIVTDGDSVKNYVGQVITITGLIVNTGKWQGKDGTIGFLNMFEDYPNNPFSITIYRQYLAFFDPIEQFKDKQVRLTGQVNKYQDKKTGKDKFSIHLKKPEQIEIKK